MAFLLRLPLLLLELLLRRLFGGDDGPNATYSPAPSGTDYVAETDAAPPVAFTGGGSPSSNGAPPPTAEEAIERRFAREAADRESAIGGNVPPPTPLRPIHDGHLDTTPEPVESFGEPNDVGGTIVIDEPWPGYDGDTAGSIVQRLRDADGATKGVVALYERANKGRKTVLKAAS